MLQFDYDHFGLQASTIANQTICLQHPPPDAGRLRSLGLDGNNHVWSFTLQSHLHLRHPSTRWAPTPWSAAASITRSPTSPSPPPRKSAASTAAATSAVNSEHRSLHQQRRRRERRLRRHLQVLSVLHTRLLLRSALRPHLNQQRIRHHRAERRHRPRQRRPTSTPPTATAPPTSPSSSASASKRVHPNVRLL